MILILIIVAYVLFFKSISSESNYRTYTLKHRKTGEVINVRYRERAFSPWWILLLIFLPLGFITLIIVLIAKSGETREGKQALAYLVNTDAQVIADSKSNPGFWQQYGEPILPQDLVIRQSANQGAQQQVQQPQQQNPYTGQEANQPEQQPSAYNPYADPHHTMESNIESQPSKEAQPMSELVQEENKPVDYSKLTSAELQELLNEKNIEFNPEASRDELIELLNKNQ